MTFSGDLVSGKMRSQSFYDDPLNSEIISVVLNFLSSESKVLKFGQRVSAVFTIVIIRHIYSSFCIERRLKIVEKS